MIPAGTPRICYCSSGAAGGARMDTPAVWFYNSYCCCPGRSWSMEARLPCCRTTEWSHVCCIRCQSCSQHSHPAAGMSSRLPGTQGPSWCGQSSRPVLCWPLSIPWQSETLPTLPLCYSLCPSLATPWLESIESTVWFISEMSAASMFAVSFRMKLNLWL